MSSILDALNKVEREQIEEDDAVNGELDAATAARYLYGNPSRKRRDRARRRVYRSKTALGAAGLIVLTAAVAAVTAYVTWGARLPLITGAAESLAPLQGTPAPAVELPPPAPPISPEPPSAAGEAIAAAGLGIGSTPAAPEGGEPPAEALLAGGAQPAQTGGPLAAMDPLAESPRPRAHAVAKQKAPAPDGVATRGAIPGAPPALAQAAPAHQGPPEPPSGAEVLPEDMNIRTLPRLSPSEQARLGLPRLEVGFVGMPNAHRQPSAMINFNKVYVNEFIPNTNVRLVAVDIYGVAVEYNGRFYFLAVRG